jgi:hypothetical protein
MTQKIAVVGPYWTLLTPDFISSLDLERVAVSLTPMMTQDAEGNPVLFFQYVPGRSLSVHISDSAREAILDAALTP